MKYRHFIATSILATC